MVGPMKKNREATKNINYKRLLHPANSLSNPVQTFHPPPKKERKQKKGKKKRKKKEEASTRRNELIIIVECCFRAEASEKTTLTNRNIWFTNCSKDLDGTDFVEPVEAEDLQIVLSSRRLEVEHQDNRAARQAPCRVGEY